jgi:hypothetical protein
MSVSSRGVLKASLGCRDRSTDGKQAGMPIKAALIEDGSA